MWHDTIPSNIISFQRINSGSSFHYWSQCSLQHHSLQQQVYQQAVKPLNTGHLFHQPASKKPNSNKLSRIPGGTVSNPNLCCDFAIHPPLGDFWLAYQLSACCILYSWIFADCCKADWRCTKHCHFQSILPTTTYYWHKCRHLQIQSWPSISAAKHFSFIRDSITA